MSKNVYYFLFNKEELSPENVHFFLHFFLTSNNNNCHKI